MHEFSIVSHLLKSCEEIAQENGAKKILVVYVEIGERSGVDSELLKSAFSEFKKEVYVKMRLYISHKAKWN